MITDNICKVSRNVAKYKGLHLNLCMPRYYRDIIIITSL